MFSIDQNSHSLWDTLPKLQAVAARHREVVHFVEDIDVAFTSLGADVDHADAMHITRERFHPSGGSDWGAALFYSDFLGRQPLDLRTLEPYLGMKIATFAKHAETSLDELYNQYSPGDNWMLVGSSYIGDNRHHRVIGDLPLDKTEKFIRRLLRLAEQDCMRRFAQPDAQQRTRGWFSTEHQRLERLLDLAEENSLVELYDLWLNDYLASTVALDVTSSLLALGADEQRTALLELFTRDYDTAAELYNQAVTETDVGLHPLHLQQGELPFFAVLRRDEHLCRTEVHRRDGALVFGDCSVKLHADGSLPIEAMRDAGVLSLAGKAMLLVLQARIGPNGRPLVLPYRGSQYMPAARRLEALLAKHDLLPGPLAPVIRVRFHLLDRLAETNTTLRLPDYLADVFGRGELPACEFAMNYAEYQNEATVRLEGFREQANRDRWLRHTFADQYDTIDRLQAQKRALAKEDPGNSKIRTIWAHIKDMEADLLGELFRRVYTDWQLSQIDFWDSRGALLPWCIAIGGEEFYQRVISRASVYEE